MVVINHGISHHDVYYDDGGGDGAVSRDFQQISGKFQSGPIWPPKWAIMISWTTISDHFGKFCLGNPLGTSS